MPVTIHNLTPDIGNYQHDVQKDITHNVQQTLSTLSVLPEVERLNAQASSEIFQAILKKNPLFINIVLTDLKGKVITSRKALKKPGSIADCNRPDHAKIERC